MSEFTEIQLEEFRRYETYAEYFREFSDFLKVMASRRGDCDQKRKERQALRAKIMLRYLANEWI